MHFLTTEHSHQCPSPTKHSSSSKKRMQWKERSDRVGHHQLIGSSEVDELFSARDRLRAFAQEIGQLKSTTIRKDAVQHCNKIKLSHVNHLSYEGVEKIVKNRIQKMIKNKRIKKNWSQEDVKILIWIISKYSDYRDIDEIQTSFTSSDWAFIASLIPGVQGENCMFKWLSLKKNNLSDNNWAQKESTLLDRIVRKYGEKDWTLVSQKLYYLNSCPEKIYRCPKQCRQHWNCYLNPQLKKGPWSKDEDLLLLNCIKKNNGLKKWAQMATKFNGRTENALKNRFTLIMDKQMKFNAHLKKQLAELQLIEKYLERSYVEQFVTMKDQKSQQKHQHEEIQNLQPNRYQSSIFLRKKALESSYDVKEEAYLFHERIHSEYFENNSLFHENCSLSLLELSQPQAIFLPSDENKIFEDDSLPLPATSSKNEPEMPELNKVKVVQLDKKNLNDLKITLMENTNEFMPCKIVGNKLTKIEY